ncbi:M48 family metallopeptidase [Parvularcula sp. IMCC14364]|uniref:M48 family metallopeptidase n=1 Tax=Parvularcula sp. IMCC14364 TaxID=3067902 RepID=UPI0027411C17|nr:M48 family metallopeptidase [Parvularcula sp. IMCC14364]
MKMKTPVHILIMSLITFLLTACETTNVAPIAASERPEETTDEAGLWLQMDESEKLLKSSALVETDKQLNEYVQSVACRVIGPDYCPDLRVYVVKQPFFNANMAPNGQMQIWTGLLLRAENEAQLAFVIGHEFAHYRQRHSLQQWREIKNLANASLIFSFGTAVAGVPEAAVLGDFSIAARLYGFGRDKEREADELGFAFAAEAGYAGKEAAAIWKYLVSEVENSDLERNRRNIARASIFSTHPVTSERIENLEALAEGQAEAGDTAAPAYIQATAPFLSAWLDDDLVQSDFGKHLFLINHLIKRGANQGVLYFRRGEAYRLRRDDDDEVLALADYVKATTFEDAPPATWREIGELHRRNGDEEKSLEAYRTYLEKAPEAADRALIDSYIAALEGSPS